MSGDLSPGLIKLDSNERYTRLFSVKEGNAVSLRSGHTVLREGENIGEHSTGDSEEMLIILEGKGELHLGSGEGRSTKKDSIVEFTEGTALYVPPNTIHDVKNIGTDILRYVFVTSPACVGEKEKCTGE